MPDTWQAWAIIGPCAVAIVGLVLLAMRGRKIKARGIEVVPEGEPSALAGLPAPPPAPAAPDCASYVAEHTAILHRIEARLEHMDKEREGARKAATVANQVSQRMFRLVMVSQDAMMGALQDAGIANGNLDEARAAISQFDSIRDDYLVDQLGKTGT